MDSGAQQLIAIGCVVAVFCAVASGMIAQSKGQPAAGYVLLGLFLGVIGLLLALVSPRSIPEPQPPGWYPDPWGSAQWRWWDGYQWAWQTS